MGAFLLFALAALMFLGGQLAQRRTIDNGLFVAPRDNTVSSSAFLAYKAAVQTYLYRNPATSGAIAAGSLGLDAVTLSEAATYGNQIVRGTSGTAAVTWAPYQAGMLGSILAASKGDQSIGQVAQNRWSTPLGGDMGALPCPVPDTDIVSVVTFTGTGFTP